METPSELANVPAIPSEHALSLELTTAEQLQDLGKQVLRDYQHRNTQESMLIVPAFVARSLQAHAVVALLVRLGYDAEAYGAMRTVTELSIDLGCIARDDGGTRMEEFVARSHLKEKRSLDDLSAAAWTQHDPTRSKELKAMIAEHPKFARDPWTYSVEERAKLGGRHAFAVTAYNIGSVAVHPGVGCLNYAYRFLPGDRLQWFPGTRRRDARALYWANVTFALTLVDAAAMLDLDDIVRPAMAMAKVCGARHSVVSCTVDQ